MPNCDHDANVFTLCNSTVGDTGNPFDSHSVSFSPVTPVTLNVINAYCIIDTGANVSLMLIISNLNFLW